MNPKARKRRLPHRRWSTEGERKRLYARRKKLDPEERDPACCFSGESIGTSGFRLLRRNRPRR